MPYRATPGKVFNVQPAPKGIGASQAAAEEAARARRPSDTRLQPNLIRTNSETLANEKREGALTINPQTRASLARLSEQAPPESIDQAEVLAAQALKITSISKGRFGALREAAYLVITLKGQIESNRYQVDRKYGEIELLFNQLEQRGRPKSRNRLSLPVEMFKRKQEELEGHIKNLRDKEQELLQTIRLAVKWLRHWIRYSIPLKTAEEVEAAT